MLPALRGVTPDSPAVSVKVVGDLTPRHVRINETDYYHIELKSIELKMEFLEAGDDYGSSLTQASNL